MSLAGYFEKRRGSSRMPTGPDPLGIRYSGKVLTGRLPLERALIEEEQKNRFYETYATTEEYDAVLRAHLGMDYSPRRR